MSIEKEYIGGYIKPKYTAVCDVCSDSLTFCDSFHEAILLKKRSNWKSVKINDEWYDRCEACVIENAYPTNV